MTKIERTIRSILGDTNRNLCSFVESIGQTEYLLFEKKIPMDDIQVTDEVYAVVAAQLKKEPGAVAKGVERLVKECWEEGDQERLEEVIGKKLKYAPYPKKALCYFAFYTYLDIPFFEYIEKDPRVLF